MRQPVGRRRRARGGRKKKRLSIEELLGLGVGCGLSVGDFERLTPEEFNAVVNAGQLREREAWERARTMATIIVQPHVRKRLQPRKLLPLPWDKAKEKRAPHMTREQARRRFEQLTGAKS